MRFRTKLFLGWVLLTLALWGGAFFAIRRSVEQSFNRMADDTFIGIHHGLQQLYVERVSSMRQACELVVNIPELRALIAEQNYELAPENQESLRERLDYVNDVVGATFLCALNENAAPLALSKSSPWAASSDFHEYIERTPAAKALVSQAFEPQGDGKYGLWVCQGRLYQVVAVPIVFQSDSEAGMARPDGALMMGKQVTDAISAELGKSYGCEISFLAGGRVVATSLSSAHAKQLLTHYGSTDSQPTMIDFDKTVYRVAFEPLVDQCTGQSVGHVVIQQNHSHAKNFLWEVWGNLFITILAGTIAAAFGSFLLSLAVTRPVQSLVTGVRNVARGNLSVVFHGSGRDELAELAGAFNDMVTRLRQSRDDLEKLLDEARRGAQRERLLHELAQQINQRLDVQSSRTMFLTSVRNLCPDVELAVFRFDPELRHLVPLERSDPQQDTSSEMESRRASQLPLNDPDTLARLGRHEHVYIANTAITATEDASAEPARQEISACVLPMRTGERLLGSITALRTRSHGFTLDERDFLQALADHFAIALANAQVYEELRRAYSELRANQQQTIQTERLRALGQMASGIAHDFNNHLTSILAFLEMSLDRPGLDDELRSWLEMSRESSMAAADVVKLLRNFYRRDTTELLQPVDINKLCEVSISLTRPRWFDMPRRQGVSVQVHEDFEDVGCVLGSSSELRDALTNLLFNAVDAMPQGGTITVRTRRVGNEIALEVQDQGTGMSDEVRAKCLEPYFTTKGMHGTGLGLSMVLAIAERHRGQLAIDSCVGRGTTIRLTLPRAAVASTEPSVLADTRHDGPKRVLCADDDSRVLKSLEGMLRQLGHNVTTTESGADAIQRVADEFFDVLITDLGMPLVDGREVARCVKKLSPHTRVLLLTGWADRLKIEGEMPEGVDQLLGKPITKAQLQQAIVGTAESHTVSSIPLCPASNVETGTLWS
jgi:signal transduction histidine kinase/ActR/RegA family two-component response regulator